MAKKITKIGNFIFNNDLSELRYAGHNKNHFIGSVALSLFLGFYIAYSLGILWELFDGFKPWFTEFKTNPAQPKWLNFIRENILYSDGFSLQDAIVWDLAGAIVGIILNWAFLKMGINVIQLVIELINLNL